VTEPLPPFGEPDALVPPVNLLDPSVEPTDAEFEALLAAMAQRVRRDTWLARQRWGSEYDSRLAAALAAATRLMGAKP
jgi:hypothetical protein